MNDVPIVTVLITCHNRRTKTCACLESLRAQDAPVILRTILFDDGSTDGTAEAVRRSYPEVEILEGSGHAFWSGGMRAAFEIALRRGADFYLWLNDDVRLVPGALTMLLTAHAELVRQRHPLCLIGGPVADPETGDTSYAGVIRPFAARPLRFERIGPNPKQLVACDTLVGNVVLVPRLTAETLGGIDPAFVHTLGDLDYGLRAVAAGGWVGLVPGHVGFCEPNTRAGRWFNRDLGLRARWRLLSHPLGFPLRPWLRFARRHGGPWWPIFALLPFWRLITPVWLAQRVDGRRSRRRRVASVRHA